MGTRSHGWRRTGTASPSVPCRRSADQSARVRSRSASRRGGSDARAWHRARPRGSNTRGRRRSHRDNPFRFAMEPDAPARVLIVAHRTAATPLLLNAVRARAGRSPCLFTLLVPRPYWDPDTEEAEATLELAIPLLEKAARGHVEGLIGDSDPFVAVREAVTSIGIDEILISTLPARVSRWLRRDLPRRVEAFGLPV